MIRNKTKKTVVAVDHSICGTILSKARGLMFRRQSFVEKTSLVFVFDDYVRTSLHMFFVFFPIDVVFLDEKKNVVEIKEGFKPFSVYIPKKKFMYVIELPDEKIGMSKISVEDVLEWNE